MNRDEAIQIVALVGFLMLVWLMLTGVIDTSGWTPLDCGGRCA